MRNTLYVLSSVLLVACSGDSDGETDKKPSGDPCDESGNICTWIGVPGEAMFSPEGLDRLKTRLFLPQDISFASDGTAYFPDFNNHRVRRVNTDGTVETISGTGMLGDGPNNMGSAANCWEGCDALTTAWNHPTDVTVNPAAENEVWVAAWHNSRINLIDTDASTMTWIAGTGGRFYAEGELNAVIMDLPSGLAFADDGTLYIADQANHLIRRITPADVMENVAGQPRFAGYSGDGGPAIDSQIHGHTDQKADPGSKIALDGNTLYIADTVNGVIRTIDLDTMTIDRFAGKHTSAGEATYTDAITGVSYTTDAGSVPGFSGDGGDALDAELNTPRDIAIGIDGEVYIADTKNNCVRVVGTDGIIETFAGQCGQPTGYDGEGVPATEALMYDPFGVAVDPDGNVYIADSGNHIIRRVAR